MNPPLPRRLMRFTLIVFALLAGTPAAADDTRRIGDQLRIIMPLAVLGLEIGRGDEAGLRQFGATWATTLAATELLKRSTHVRRPDDSDDQSWPSGHAAHAFAAAAYLHRRHGLDAAWPAYLAATYVGWTRVEARRHRWIDIAGSAVLASLASRAWVQPDESGGWSVRPSLQGQSLGLAFRTTW